MIDRSSSDKVNYLLDNFSTVALLGPRQVGKTTLAKSIAAQRPSVYLDLENPQDLAKLHDAHGYLTSHLDKLVILDEIQRRPEIFPMMRGFIDRMRQEGRPTGHYLVLGSASMDLLRQSSESLAGRIIYEEMWPILLNEYPDRQTLWVRGGFPDSLMASSDKNSMAWRQSFITTYLERDIPFFSPRISGSAMRRLWTMLAHLNGSTLNASQLGNSLSLNNQSVSRYVDLLSDLFLVRKLQPWFFNTGKRMIKSPKVYVRDSGVLHALLNIADYEQLMSHPVVGTSWEGFAIENIMNSLPGHVSCSYYRTAGGAEIDLIIEFALHKTYAIEIKSASVPKLERGFYEACEDIKPVKKFVVYQGEDEFPMRNDVTAIGLKGLIKQLQSDR